MPSGVVSQVELPAEAAALATLSRVDYTDAFRADVSSLPPHSGEEWAREIIEGAPASVRKGLRQGWTALGLKLAPTGADGCVLGWRIRHSDAGYALLGMDSRIGMPAELLLRPDGGSLLFATFVRQDNILARAVWTGIGPRHRRIVPRLIAAAVARQAGR
ncbi:MAG TPA: hypothetical protein VHV53_02285 [Solirubrobacterales bacterium]|nr:hypothetical protein [Solirubrobacterales bacterium]